MDINALHPNFWVIVLFKHKEEEFYRIFSSWSGSYLTGSSWRFNSGIKTISENEDHYIINGDVSNTTYACHKSGYGIHFHSQNILKNMEEKYDDVSINILSEEEAKKYIEENL